jgi:hypothetical protein
VHWSSDLEADPTRETEGEGATYTLPLETRIGATGILTPRLSVHVGASVADWKPSEDGLDPESVVGQVWSFGGGVEWGGPSLGSRDLPLRVGYRTWQLPFRFEGEDPVEAVVSAGLGLNLTQVEDVVLAGVDLALERGSREAGALSETFWRGTLTFRVSGW